MTRQMKLGLSVASNGTHKGGWRHSGAWSGGNLDIKSWAQIAKAAEAAAIHFMFWADGAAVRIDAKDDDALSMSAQIDNLDPLVLIGALSQHTQRIGFIATASTSFNEPYNIARRFASLDFISGGRVGWNVVTSWSDREARNFNHASLTDHALRYKKGGEFLEVVKGLWDSWDDDAFKREKSSSRYFDPSKMHTLDHVGEFYSVRGPLNVPRSPQGHPLITQAGSSETGQELAAQTADVVYTAQQDLGEAQAFYKGLKSRVERHGRSPDALFIMPGILPIIGETDAEAQSKFNELQDLLHPVAGYNAVAQVFGDLSAHSEDTKLLDVIPESGNMSKGIAAVWLERAKREDMTISDFYKAYSIGGPHKVVVGSAQTVADIMEEWFTGRACDGMNIMSPWMPGGYQDVFEKLVPELQKRGLFRKAYEGETLREDLGLSRPGLPR